MKIRELLEDRDNLPLNLTAVTAGIANQFIDTNSKSPMNLDAFLEMLNDKAGIQFDKDDFRVQWNKTPLVNIISDVVGNKVIFRGQRKDVEQPVSTSSPEGTIKKMAKRAADKRI
jgi:hypothetical protein